MAGATLQLPACGLSAAVFEAVSPLTLGGVWTCASPRRDLKVSLVKSGDAAVLRVTACGTLLLFR